MAFPYRDTVDLRELGDKIKDYVARHGSVGGEVWCKKTRKVIGENGASCDRHEVEQFFGFPALNARTVRAGIVLDEAEFKERMRGVYEDLRSIVNPLIVSPRAHDENYVEIHPKLVVLDDIPKPTRPAEFDCETSEGYRTKYELEIEAGKH